jgi:RimJ/RimL family protein N-acetyltransferase
MSKEPWTQEQIAQRLKDEINNGQKYGIQYWPIFDLSNDAHIGCVGLRPYCEGTFEFGFHLKPEYWGRGIATEVGRRVIKHAFESGLSDNIFAGHHPDNKPSRNALIKLGLIGGTAQYFERTGLMHPAYYLYRGERDFSTRPTVAGDARALALVHCHSIRDTFQMLPEYVAARSLDYCEQRWDERMNKQQSDTLALLHGEQIVGFVTAAPSPDKDVRGKAGEVDRLYIHPCAWNKGHGTTLIKWCEQRLLEQGFNLIKLWVFEVNERGRHFYEKHGYKPDGHTKSDFRGKILRYGKYLQASPPYLSIV